MCCQSVLKEVSKKVFRSCQSRNEITSLHKKKVRRGWEIGLSYQQQNENWVRDLTTKIE